MRNGHRIVGALGLFFVLGCAKNSSLRDRAAYDLQCPRAYISVLEGGNLRDVEGCGRRATYAWTGHAWVPAQPAQYYPTAPSPQYSPQYPPPGPR